MLKLENLKVVRGENTLVENLNLELNSGEVLLVTGKNGSGKSTLAAVISGDYPSALGSVNINGKLGVLLQNLEINFPITVADFLGLADKSFQSNELAKRLVSNELYSKKITELSVGQLQRVELAQVILQNADIYLLDEPFSAQDYENTALILEILKSLKLSGKSIVLINHVTLNLDELIDKTLNLH